MDKSTPTHVLTSDGSSTLFSPAFDQHYHSVHGAIQESLHVFIRAGLEPLLPAPGGLRIWEMGFGTGLNALLTWLQAGDTPVTYTAIEAYPLDPALLPSLNYAQVIADPRAASAFVQLHDAPWEVATQLRPGFTLLKHATSLEAYQPAGTFDLLFYDAFAPNAQPELWTEAVMARLFSWLDPGGIFITYSAKSSVRRGLLQAGFEVEKLPGPPGKREMLRARRPLADGTPYEGLGPHKG